MIIWLASYPRSGNTFLRIILNNIFNIKTYSVYNDLKDIESHIETKATVGHILLPKDFNIESARNSGEDYFIKTHKHPSSITDKVIYIIRDGRNSICSYYHYRNEYNTAPPLVDFIEGNNKVGSWSEHVEKWSAIDKENILLIPFDELVGAPLDVVPKIASFIGKEPLNSSLPDFEDLHRINPKFFKSGINRSYKELFSAEEHLLFWKLHHTQMIRFNFINDIPERFKNLM